MFNIKNVLIPSAAKVEGGDEIIKIGTVSNTLFNIKADECLVEAEKLIAGAFENKASALPAKEGYEIIIEVNPDNKEFSDFGKPDAYIINISKDRAILTGWDNAGAYYAAVTFAKLLHNDNNSVMLPLCTVYDYPYFEKRGHFMECRYGSDFMTLEDWKKGIDYLSEMKINTITLGLYGCWTRQYDGQFAEYQYIPFEKYPELKTPRDIKYYSVKERKHIYKHDILPTIYKDDYFGDMIEYAKTKHITVIPLFNSLGHNTLIPRVFPEVSAVGEDGNVTGVSFCTNNEKTYEIMFSIYDEIIDRYLKPNGIDSFEIGMDEVFPVVGADENDIHKAMSPFCLCEKCRNEDHGQLMLEYIIKLVKHLKEKGMKNVYVYHDMLFEHDLLNDELVDRLKKEDIYDIVVIDWWTYENTENLYDGKADKVNSKFRSVAKPLTGYYHWRLPSQANGNIYDVTEIAKKHNFEGIIAYSSFEYCYDYNYKVLAECAWSQNSELGKADLLSRYANEMFPENPIGAQKVIEVMQNFMLGQFVTRENFCETIFDYYQNTYLKTDLEYPQDYPAKPFKMIRDDEAKYLPFLRNILIESENAYRFFDENASSEIGDVWKLMAKTFNSLVDEFYSIYMFAKAYNDGSIDENMFVAELNRLIKEREKTMALCETTRIEANSYTLLRNMSIYRQFTIDLRDYIKEQITKGKKPEVDIFSFWNILSDYSKFLR